MTDARPYKPAVSVTEAKRYLTEWAGIEFDPKIVKAFLSLEGVKELEAYSAEADYEKTSDREPEIFSSSIINYS
jgi:HD-GYP domain-containing protein (c-di-GMP phosphodiesterase class II)